MTANQLQYWANAETKRANRANEWQAMLNLQETRRHNLETEATNRYIAKANYYLGLQSNSITAANNNRRNQLTQQQIVVTEAANRRSAAAASAANRLRAEELSESSRASKAREGYNLTNLAMLQQHYGEQVAENIRSNMANEGIRRSQLSIDSQKNQETRRHNLASEKLQASQIAANLVSSLAGSAARVIGGQINGTKKR